MLRNLIAQVAVDDANVIYLCSKDMSETKKVLGYMRFNFDRVFGPVARMNDRRCLHRRLKSKRIDSSNLSTPTLIEYEYVSGKNCSLKDFQIIRNRLTYNVGA